MTDKKSIAARRAAVVAALTEPKKGGENPHFQFDYVTLPDLLAHLRGPLNEHGLLVWQEIDGLSLITYLVDQETGEGEVIGHMEIPSSPDPQKVGSAITYYRRYSLMAAFSLSGEDDDGNSAKPSPSVTASTASDGAEPDFF